ncbi:MAG: MBOAT family O-acyltransferase [Coriobacteriia bacterium]
MQFTSVAYMLFLGLAVAVYYALPGVRSRTIWLLAASIAFYYSLSAAWTVVLLAVVLIGYTGGRLIERTGESRDRKRLLTGSIVLVAGVLAVFKYTTFASALVNDGLALFGSDVALPLLRLALPVGVSFWTFQTIAYLVDVYRGTLKAERNMLTYALFVSFFAHVTAGPIARGSQLLPQLAEKRRFSYEGMRSALLLMGWGFFKKLIVADTLGVMVNTVYADPQAWAGSTHGLVLGIATVAFSVQIYCDFSGYTDIVRGSARLFGVDLARNFDRPYFARSVKEFWRRWHMTLMGWLKDYIYIPLGGSRVAPWRRYANILAVFAISGIWHGAGFTFIVWGLLNGAYQVLGDLTSRARERLATMLHIDREHGAWKLVQVIITFALITVAWVFFRAESLADALYILPRMFTPTFGVLSDGTFLHLGLSKPQTLVGALGVLVVVAVDFASLRFDLPAALYSRSIALRWLAYVALILVVVVFGYYGPLYQASSFAYFKF